jgi:putative ABC transport system permease protein
MFRSYFTIALRTLSRHRSYTLINVLGLALGITGSLVIYAAIRYETGFDAFHTQSARTYRVVQHNRTADGTQYWNTTAYPLAEALRHDFPEVRVTQTAGPVSRIISSEDEAGNINRFEEDKVLFADPEYLRIFNFKGVYPGGQRDLWLQGSPETAFQHPHSVVLTQRLAERYFRDAHVRNESLLGKTLMLNNKDVLTVTGVIRNPPANTSLLFEMLIPYAFFQQNNPYFAANWSGNYQGTTYVMLPDAYPAKELEKKIAAFQKKYLKPEDNRRIRYFLQPLREIHTETRYGSSPGSYVVSQTTLGALAGMAVFLVVIACVNFVNLSTAQAVKRSREVGVRKVLGGTREQLFRQFMGETLVITSLALLLSLLLTDLALRQLNQWLTLIHLQLSLDLRVVLFALALTLLVALLAGAYPSLVLSGYPPLLAIQRKMIRNGRSGLSLRRALIVLQFGIAQVLIVGTLVMASQMEYFRKKDLGFRKEAIVNINVPNPQPDKLELLRQRLLQHPQIENVSFASGAPTTTNRSYGTGFRLHHEPEAMMREAEMKVVDLNYLPLYQLQLLAGTWLTEANRKGDAFNGFVVNETLVRMLGLTPESAIGKTVIINEGEAPVIGVVRDFHNKSLQDKITPCLLFYWNSDFLDEAGIRLRANGERALNVHETLAYTEKTWKEIFPDGVYQYSFLDDYLARNYLVESLSFGAFQVFAAIAIFIGCLGLYGLVSFMAETRTREIGIRKVLGASVSSLVMLFSKEFAQLIILAFLLAAPLSWYLMNQWLQDFTYRIDIGADTFVLALALTLAVAALSVGYRAIKAALANPVKSLRVE